VKYTDLDLSDKTILITGGAGFIGSNLAFYFQEKHPDCTVVVLDIFRDNQKFENGNLKSFGHFKNLLGFNGEIIAGDINDKSLIERLESYKFDYIFHQAAISDTTVLDQTIMIETNVNAFKLYLDLAVTLNASIIYASSAATYGNAPSPQTVGIEEPENVYGFSKLMMDQIAYKYMKKYPDMNIVGLRYFNVYGKREYFKNKTSSMILQLGLQVLSSKTPRLFYDSDKILRDFIYIEDVIQANIKAMSSKKSGVYNVGTAKPRSFQDISDILQKEIGVPKKTEYFKNPYKAYQTYTEANIDKTKEFLDYAPRFSLEDGIKDYLQEIRKIYEREVNG
jgi:ADP-L-glycero-D-manno-heptose 6-epimerase